MRLYNFNIYAIFHKFHFEIDIGGGGGGGVKRTTKTPLNLPLHRFLKL